MRLGDTRVGGFVARNAAVIAVAWVTVVAGVAIAGVQVESRHRAEAIRTEERERAEAVDAAAKERVVQICTEARNFRALVSELIDTAVGDPSAVRVPFDAIPSFGGMPMSVQTFLRDYARAQSQGASGPDLAQRLRVFQAERLGALPEFCA